MATEGGYAETYPQMAGPSPRMASKRKRGPTDSPGNMRASPMTRRNNAQYGMGQHIEGTVIGAPTASMNDAQANNYTDYGLPHLQPNMNRTLDGGDNSNVDTAAAALNYSMQVPPHPADTFLAQTGTGEGDQSAYDEGNTSQYPGGGAEDEDDPDGSGAKKPDVGSEEWQRMRKDNHKEVERRRRETINEGINELAKIVPGCEKNKGSILARAVQYIQKLQDENSQNLDRWTFEKLVTEQAINDLSGKLSRAWAEKEAWKKVASDAGVEVEGVDLGLGEEAGKEEEGGDAADDDGDAAGGDGQRPVDDGAVALEGAGEGEGEGA